MLGILELMNLCAVSYCPHSLRRRRVLVGFADNETLAVQGIVYMASALLGVATFALLVRLLLDAGVVYAGPNDLESQPRICLAKVPSDLDIDSFPADDPNASRSVKGAVPFILAVTV